MARLCACWHGSAGKQFLRFYIDEFKVFEPFGAVELVTRRMDSSKGWVLSSLHVLKMLEPLQSLNGQLDIAGRIIKVFECPL